MASVTLNIGNRRYELACRAGEEAHLTALAAVVDAKAAEAGRALGSTTEVRQLLLAALLLADDLAERPAPAPQQAAPDVTEGLADALDTLAQRVEALAMRLEKPADGA